MAKKVLIIDDEIHIIKIIQYKLNSAGLEVVFAQNGPEGIKIANEELPNIILLDIMMPAMNGYEVLEHLKENEKTKNIPVVMITAKTQEGDKQKAEKIGVTAYIFKPFSPQAVLEVVENILGG